MAYQTYPPLQQRKPRRGCGDMVESDISVPSFAGTRSSCMKCLNAHRLRPATGVSSGDQLSINQSEVNRAPWGSQP